ncbi:hypothetical protein C1646_759431 [Rhizophagus diaphanus]|nr:hypothetical protein C1646_759431 [Rhizophagus diaphanus] [Rhizophagus sp. MUCL 43196]
MESTVSESEFTEELELLSVHAFCSTGIPFNVIKNVDFQAFLQKACPSFYILLHHILSVYTKKEYHTGENIAKGIEECMILIGIDKFTAVITDNANNMKLAWRILKEKIQKEKYGYKIALILMVETRWMSVFECLDHILKIKIAMRALLAEENIILNQKIKNYIIDDSFVTLRDIENNILLNNKIPNDLVEYSIDRAKYQCDNFLYNPTVIITYRLDPRFNGELVNSSNWHDIIKEEIIRIARKDNEIRNLLKSSHPLLSSIAIKVLSIPASSTAKLEVSLTVKELIKSSVKMSNLESDDEKLGKESDKELEDNVDSNFETLTKYEENEFYLDLND